MPDLTQNAFFRRLMLMLGLFCIHLIVTVQAGDVTIETNHPQYPGEGAFQTIDDCVQFAVRNESDPQKKAIAMYNWFLTHQWHLMSPMEWLVPGRVPDTADPGDYETVIFDANRARFSYGYGLCGTVHAWNEPYWKALGFPARRREFPNHINSEIYYRNAWHAFDTDMAGLLFRKDGTVAGYDDIISDPRLSTAGRPPVPHYPFAWPSDFDTMKAGWAEVARRGQWYSLYNGGYAAHPAIVDLRPGESFTRWFDRDHFGGPTRRRFWQNQKNGPHRQWTCFNNGTPEHLSDGKANARSEATYCNGEFVYQPPLSKVSSRLGMADYSPNIGHRTVSPELFSKDGEEAFAVFRHFSPYVICGDPLDDANPMSGMATDGLVMTGEITGIVTCRISNDEAQTWTDIDLPQQNSNVESSSVSGRNTRRFQVDLTENVKGRYGWQIQFRFHGTSGVNQLRFVTTTQVCQAMYPRLTTNGCHVTFRSADRSVVAVLPNFSLPENRIAVFEETTLRSPNLRYEPRSIKNRYAYQATDQNPAHVVFRVSAPQTLREIRAAVRYQLPVPPTDGCRVRLQVSTNGGNSWENFATADIPMDNEFSSGWLSGKTDIHANRSNAALVRVEMHMPGRQAALIDAQLYGVHEAASARVIHAEFGWTEGGHSRTHATRIRPVRNIAQLHVPTGAKITDQFVRLTAP